MIRVVPASDLAERAGLDAFLGRGEAAEDRAGPTPEDVARRIIGEVRSGGDEVLLRLAAEFDHVDLRGRGPRVPPEAVRAAAARCDARVRDALKDAARAIYRFHRPQRPRAYHLNAGASSRVAQRVIPLDTVGLYVPGGRAAYASTVLMNAIPARVAGVRRIVAATPPRAEGLDAAVAAALVEVGVDEVYAVGGAQAVAALAYGTETVPRVDKVVGPGNAFVAAAKKLVFGDVAIDQVAGPTEVVIVADGSADPRYVAAEMCAQAEHDPDATAVAIVIGEALAAAVAERTREAAALARRRDVVERSLGGRGGIAVSADLDGALALADRIAPEHLVLMVKKPRAALDRVRAAGCVMCGPYTPVALGDYAAGPNHVLPTGGSARFASPLGVYDFVRRMNVLEFTARDLARKARTVVTLAEAEGLFAHAESVRIRGRA